MSRWINVFLVYVLLGAVLLIITRALLPMIGLGGFAEELIQPLTRLTPILFGVGLATLTLITFNLRRQSKLAKKWEEAEYWGNESIIGGDAEPSSANAGVSASLNNGLKTETITEGSNNYQADERNGSSNGRSVGKPPAFTTATQAEGLEMAAAAATAVLDKVRGERRPATAEVVRELSEDRANKRSENKDNVSSRMTTFLRVTAI